MDKNFKYLGTISVFFVSILLISNIVSTKIVNLGLLSFDAGTLLFPLSYIFGDILTEVYGYKRNKRVIWLGFFVALFMSLIFFIVGKLPADPNWANQEAYDLILGQTPRIVLASLIAYFFGSFSNSFILAKLKILTKGSKLWLRTICSTLVGEFLDSLIFVFIAFYGIFNIQILIIIFISNYIFKSLIEILFTPLTYKLVKFLKREEGEDYFDTWTNFNPFIK